MSMSDLEQFLQLVSENESEADFEGEKSSELINAAENALGLTFPPTYRRFVEQLGCGDIAGFEIYGVLSKNFADSGIPDAIWLTLDERRTSQLPESLILVSDIGDGSYYAIDCSTKHANGESPVVIRLVDGTSSEPVHSDFGEFARERLESAVA